jgi:hypothetical protein
MDDIAVLGILLGVLGALGSRALLLRRLRTRHPSVFVSRLGAPKLRQLAGSTVRHARRQLQWRFLKFLWTGEFLKLRDSAITGIGFLSIIFDVGTIGLFLALFFGATK